MDGRVVACIQSFRASLDIEIENYHRSLRRREETVKDTRKQSSKTRMLIMPVGFQEKNLAAILQVWEEAGDNFKSFSRACHDPGLVQSTKCAKSDGSDEIEPFFERWRPGARLSPGCTASMDVLNVDEVDADTPDISFFDFGNSFRSIFDETKVVKSGWASQVSRVRIRSYSAPGSDGGGKKDIVFAVKKMYSGSFQGFARERDAYRRMRLSQNPHPHIVPLFATYVMEGRYHFVFPSANYDLATYWRTQTRPNNGKLSLQWFAGQIRGLADALTTVHGQKGQARDFYGVHGDIKPENILCFVSNDSDRGPRFALSDFGSSYFCTPEHRDIPKGLKHTPAYRAPETDTTSLGISKAYDIWGLGCVFAEAIAWLYDGKAGIAKLIDARLDADNSPNRDAFFRLQYDKKGSLTAKLKPEVHRLLISLREKSESSLFIDDMLYLVLEGMLKVSISERMSAREILDALTQMCTKLEDDPAYSVLCNKNPTSDPTLKHDNVLMSDPMEMVHTNQDARHRLDRTVDATYYTNSTTQSFSDAAAQTGLKPRFACPYHKAGILVSAHHRACEGPGWNDVNKVKEHLTRCHLPKKYKGKNVCRRCDTSFETDELLLAHQHQETPCLKKKPEAIYGMLSREQAARLRSLKRKSSKESEEDRWFDIYRIAFPNFNRMLDNISPYNQDHESNNTSLSTINSTSSNGISQYKDYLLNRDAEEYATKLANMGIDVTQEAAAKLLKLQVKDLENFDETLREPVRAYGFETDADHEKAGDSVPSRLNGSSDLLGQ